MIASVNARSDDWHAAVAALDAAWDRFGDVVERFVGRRVPADRFADALAYRGIKAALRVRLIRGVSRILTPPVFVGAMGIRARHRYDRLGGLAASSSPGGSAIGQVPVVDGIIGHRWG